MTRTTGLDVFHGIATWTFGYSFMACLGYLMFGWGPGLTELHQGFGASVVGLLMYCGAKLCAEESK